MRRQICQEEAMALRPPTQRGFADKEAIRRFFLQLQDDTEDAPWMVMGSLQWDSTNELYMSLHEYAERHEPTWYVGGMCAILYTAPETQRRQQLAPDLFVAFVSRQPRESFDADVEGFPPFVLEVVSASSAYRDLYEKRSAYEALGVREYVLFYPSASGPSRLDGFRRGENTGLDPWVPDEQGRLWSDLLGLYFFSLGRSVRAANRGGALIRTLHEALRAAEEEAAARQAAEAEVAALRKEIERLKRELPR